MKDFKKWSLERVQFLLSHVEDFIDNESEEWRERAKSFTPELGLGKVETLSTLAPSDPHVPMHVLERLSPFFDAGMLIQRGPAEDSSWWITDLMWRGSSFHLDGNDQVKASGLIPEITPLQVHRASAGKMLERVNLSFLERKGDADAFMLKPTPSVAFVLISGFAAPWAEDHLAQAQRLINKAFIY